MTKRRHMQMISMTLGKNVHEHEKFEHLHCILSQSELAYFQDGGTKI